VIAENYGGGSEEGRWAGRVDSFSLHAWVMAIIPLHGAGVDSSA
jgi:hypothetical protein